jgi:Fuc2NAc and GlcNAc transferase
MTEGFLGGPLGWAVWCAAAAAVSAAATSAVLQWAGRLGMIDRPNARSSHIQPTPRGGGLGIVAVAVGAIGVLLALGVPPPAGSGWVLLGAALVAAVSVGDDVSSISPRLRLGIHLAAAGLAVFGAGPARVVELGSLGTFDFGPAGWALAVLWIVGMTNAFNFMDGIDGIAGITAAAALGVLAGGFAAAGDSFLGLLAAALAAAAAGFLVWNWHPARIFMGDVGSASLGYAIATLPLLAGPEASRWLLPLTALVMWPFLFDTIYTLVRRLAKRENVFEAHRSHLYQRLVIAGWSHGTVTTLYGLASLVAGGAALFALAAPRQSQLAELVAVGTVVIGAAGLVALVHASEARVTSGAGS